MQIDLRTVSITPLRQTYNHIAERQGADKPASRYIEGTMNVQPDANFHYRPTWDPQHELFDPRRTRLVMQDWYALKDPRQFYYGAWTIARARQQDAADSSFEMIEERGLAGLIPAELKQLALDVLVPLRHMEWGGNMGNVRLVQAVRRSGANLGQDGNGRVGRTENYYLTVHRLSTHRQ